MPHVPDGSLLAGLTALAFAVMRFVSGPARIERPAISRDVKSSRATNLVDAQEIVEECLDHALHISAVPSELVDVGNGENGQGLSSIVSANCGL
jgi:hypothetical protein